MPYYIYIVTDTGTGAKKSVEHVSRKKICRTRQCL
jgi:hypothetical protein